ncbi:transcriptional repressor LexA [Brachyspira sp.]|uniref:transcriptional repressor LexA n=1 Tax=Brachyspira sp. TaxID=1977261 RepID=UPI003D7DE808
MTELTEKQKEMLDFMRKFTNENGYPPTVKEMMARFNFASPTAVTTHLIALEKKGFIKKTGNRARGSVPVNRNKNYDMVNIPLLSKLSREANAGVLMDSAEEIVEDTFTLPKSIAKDEGNFLIKVVDDSMIDAHIKEGDMVLVNPINVNPNNGDIVVAKIDNNGNEEITIKRFFRENDYIELVSENKNYPPIRLGNVPIIGKVVGLIRLNL